jgi:demethylmenaquinone methyltransferase/2-methoxy-6-polyprenyl-1,4-benzoquinol methylase
MFDHFGLLAPIYDRVIGPPDAGRLRDLLRLPAAGRMLDAGGGTGRVSSQLRGLIGELVISDLSGKMLHQARGKGNLEPVQGHAERLPFPTACFDRVLVVDALHHFCEQREAIGDLLRVLKPGGRLVIEEPDLNRFAVKLVALAERLALMRSRFFYPAEIRDMVAAHGLAARVEVNGGFAAWVVVDK